MRYHELEHHREEDFIQRHIGPAAHDIEAMLKIIGFDSLDRMTDAILPKSIHMSKALEVCPPASEDSLLHIMKKFAGQNRVLKSLIGQGYYGTITPPVLQRNILENPAWYTAYTPYQPEISQGRLEALLNFQTMICDLTASLSLVLMSTVFIVITCKHSQSASIKLSAITTPRPLRFYSLNLI